MIPICLKGNPASGYVAGCAVYEVAGCAVYETAGRLRTSGGHWHTSPLPPTTASSMQAASEGDIKGLVTVCVT